MITVKSISSATLSDQDLLSRTISALRMPLIVGVAFIHNSSSGMAAFDEQLAHVSRVGVDACIILVSGVLASCAVPLFFLFSGYLFFKNITTFTPPNYKSKLKSRCRSILQPYLVWVTIGVLFYGLLNMIPFTRQFFGNGYFSWSPNYILEQYTGFKLVDGITSYQMCYHLWFLRDLFCMVLISPVFYVAGRRLKWLTAALLGTMWLAGIEIPGLNDRGFNTQAIVFFGIGALLAVNNINFVTLLRRAAIPSYIIYPLLVFITWQLKLDQGDGPDEKIFLVSKAAMIIAAIPFWINVTSDIIRAGKINPSKFLATGSFFVYLIHIPFVQPQLRKILFHVINPTSEAELYLIYFATVLLGCALSLAIYYILQKTLPRVASFLIGGR